MVACKLIYISKNLIINYCADCCSTYIESWEKLLHYGCQRSCVNVIRQYEKEVRDRANKPVEKEWIPKKLELVDF
jgi:hypothetical protein